MKLVVVENEVRFVKGFISRLLLLIRRIIK